MLRSIKTIFVAAKNTRRGWKEDVCISRIEKKSGGIRMRSRVLKRSIEDVGDTVNTLFAIQEEVVLETQVSRYLPQ
jgi:hypothetical protein